MWCKPSQEFWKAAVEGKFGEDWWKQNLRMKKDTFDIVCSILRPYIIEKQVSILKLQYKY